MNEDNLWNFFCKSGNINDYLHYKAAGRGGAVNAAEKDGKSEHEHASYH